MGEQSLRRLRRADGAVLAGSCPGRHSYPFFWGTTLYYYLHCASRLQDMLILEASLLDKPSALIGFRRKEPYGYTCFTAAVGIC